MSKYYGAVAYNDEKLYATVYSLFEGQQYVIANELVYSGDIAMLSSMESVGKIAKQLNDTMGGIEEEIGTRIHRLDLIVDPKQFYYESKSFEVIFEEMHAITADDIKKITDKAVRYDTAKAEYTNANFTPTAYIIDGVEKANPIGVNGRKITITGDLVFVDSNTIYPIERIIDDSRYRQDNILVSSHLLKYSRGFNDNEAIVEFGRMKMKFITKTDGLTQNFNMDFGLGHIYQKTYMKLVEEFTPEDSEKAVRCLQNNFKLTDAKFDFELTPGIKFSYASSIFKSIASEYIQGVLLQVYKQGIQIKKIYSITNDYANDEWVQYLKSFLEIEVKEYEVKTVNGNFKQELKIFNSIAVADKMRLKG